MSWIDTFVQKLFSSGLASPETLKGCSVKDIEQLEAKLKVTLPAAYRDFLFCMGRSAGQFMPECSFTYPEIEDCTRDIAETLLKAHTRYQLSDTSFVFVERYGCQFFFFETTQGEDPPVFRYFEGDELPVQIADSISSAFEMALDDELMDLNSPNAGRRPYLFSI